MKLPADVTAPTLARHAVEERLSNLDAVVRREATSVVSELVADAVRRANPPIELVITPSGGRVRIDISDAGDDEIRPDSELVSQRIIAGFARWGVHREDAHVWFEVPADRFASH